MHASKLGLHLQKLTSKLNIYYCLTTSGTYQVLDKVLDTDNWIEYPSSKAAHGRNWGKVL